ncbi:MAG: Mov34/MPN/PAD-1 family protein [Polyangiales bacterium]
MTGQLAVTRAALDAVLAHARESLPDECCGLLLGLSGDAPADEAARFDNLADRYHAADPAAFPRTARTAYVMDASRVRAAIARGAATGRPVRAIYHSHPARGAYFSDEDEAMARAADDLLADVAWLVAGAQGEVRAYAYDPVRDAFVERVVTVVSAS